MNDIFVFYYFSPKLLFSVLVYALQVYGNHQCCGLGLFSRAIQFSKSNSILGLGN